MGYYVEYEVVDVMIPTEKLEDALAAVNAMFTDEALEANASGGCWGGDSESKPVRERKWYSWVENPPEGEYWNSLADVISEFGFECQLGEEGLEIGYWNFLIEAFEFWNILAK